MDDFNKRNQAIVITISECHKAEIEEAKLDEKLRQMDIKIRKKNFAVNRLYMYPETVKDADMLMDTNSDLFNECQRLNFET